MILLIAIVVVTYIVVVAHHYYLEEDGGWAFIIGLGLTAVVAIVAFFVVAFLSFIPEGERQTIDTQELVTIEDGSSTGGDFFLGTGSIKDRQVFSFYAKQDNGFVLDSVYATDAVIRYDDDPRVVTTAEVVSPSWWHLKSGVRNRSKEYIIYVPEGSIKQNFVLDAKE